MQSLKEAFKDIIFIEEGHKYWNKFNNKELISVTTYKKKWEQEFNKSFWLSKNSSDLGITEKQLEFEWNLKGKIGRERGTILHSYLENRAKRKIVVPYIPSYIDKNEIKTLFKQADDYIDVLNLPILELEFVVGNDFLGGTIDKVLSGDKESLVLRDYKTGKLKEGYSKLKSPYDYLDDSSLNKYTIQMNLYTKLLEEKGFNVSKLEVVWFNADNDTYKIIDIPKIEVIL